MVQLISRDDNLKMSSKEIAELTGKRHDNILRDVDNLNANYLEMNELKIEYVENQGLGAMKQREAFLTKIQCLDLLTGYDTKLRIKVNRRWAELEAKEQAQLPQTFAEALQLAADQAKQLELKEAKIKEEQSKNLILESANKDMIPKAIFADSVSESDDTILIRDLAHQISQNGYKIGQKKLFEWMKDNGYLCRRKNEPTQRAIELGVLMVKETVVNLPDKDPIVRRTPKVTGKGQQYFTNKFLKDDFKTK